MMTWMSYRWQRRLRPVVLVIELVIVRVIDYPNSSLLVVLLTISAVVVMILSAVIVLNVTVPTATRSIVFHNAHVPVSWVRSYNRSPIVSR